MSKNKYYIADFNTFRIDGGWQQLSEDAVLDNLWVSNIPHNCEDIPTPKLFDKRGDAMEWKDRVQAQYNADWQENSHIHKMYGKSKAQFKIYKYKESVNDTE